MTIGTDLPQLIGSHPVKSTVYTCVPGCAVSGGLPWRGYCRPDCQIFGPDDYGLDFTALFTYSSSMVFKFYSDAKPAIADIERNLRRLERQRAGRQHRLDDLPQRGVVGRLPIIAGPPVAASAPESSAAVAASVSAPSSAEDGCRHPEPILDPSVATVA